MNEVAVDEADDYFGSLRLRRQRVAEPLLYIDVITETTGDGEDDSNDRNDSKQRAVGQRGCCHKHLLVEEPLYGEQQHLQQLIEEKAYSRYFVALHAPNVHLKKMHQVAHQFSNLNSQLKVSAPISRVLFRQ